MYYGRLSDSDAILVIAGSHSMGYAPIDMGDHLGCLKYPKLNAPWRAGNLSKQVSAAQKYGVKPLYALRVKRRVYA